MAKEFSARVSKRERKVTDITSGIDEKILPSLYQILSSAVYDRVSMKEK